MKLQTEDQKMAYLLGYTRAMAEQHAKEFDRDVNAVQKDLLESALAKRNK